jgi:hypothetical protein
VGYYVSEILGPTFPQDTLNTLKKLPSGVSKTYSCIIQRIKENNALDSVCVIFSWLYHMPQTMCIGKLIQAFSIHKVCFSHFIVIKYIQTHLDIVNRLSRPVKLMTVSLKYFVMVTTTFVSFNTIETKSYSLESV